MIKFFVPGIPAPQGSKTPWGTEANKNTMPWRDSIKAVALQEFQGKPFDCSLFVTVEFYFPRPKAHFKKNGQLNPTKAVDWKSSKPDTDKLIRAVGDAGTGILWRDDNLIVKWIASKIYCPEVYESYQSPGMSIKIEPAEELPFSEICHD